MEFGSSKYWEDFTEAQAQINADNQLTHDQKLDRLLFIILSDEDPKNWIKPIEGS